ncbi:hypothetical protein N7539_003312 [Penicillium diatomitis]|uniref:Uncharacterized protein n=1 Tax=Penicillium diatomitis TaxID=2819901 RepID=A0A9W9XGB8_9EURO|nr:uncharacterized protein N7539_003312 [Penicillium diatomitis]KAJ5491745.1 hypothetical protein N7539_003312 [Penicillium diatomitis]
MAAFIAANLNPFNYFGGVRFRPETDIPDLSGKVILITGGNTGLGKETVLQLARHNPRKIYLGARTESKAVDAIKSIKEATSSEVDIVWLPLDLTSTNSIRNAAEKFQAETDRLDRLILNAGVMALPPGETELGHEIQLGTNHTGHFMLTKLLMPTLLKTAEASDSDVRIVSLSSVAHNLAPSFETILDQGKLKKVNTNSRYGASKAANILLAAELSRRYPSITSVSVHPGVILTDLYESMNSRSVLLKWGLKLLRFFGSSIPQGALNSLWAAAGAKKDDLRNGAYYVPVGNCKPRDRYVRKTDMAKRLWDWSESEARKAGL